MTKIVLKPAIQVISGDIGGFVYRHQADGSVVIAKAGVHHGDDEPYPLDPCCHLTNPPFPPY